MKFRLSLNLSAAVALVSVPASISFASEPIRLFPPSPPGESTDHLIPVEHYDRIVESLAAHDVLAFQDGASFEFIDYIGHGKTTNVLRVKALSGAHAGQTMVLRIPISRNTLAYGQNWYGPIMYDKGTAAVEARKLTYSRYINATLEHADLFARAEIGPRFFGGLPGQYAAFQYIEKKFSLDEYLSRRVKLPAEEDKVVQAALLHFERKTAGISEIGDISQPGQVVFDGKKFVLVDWFRVSFVEGDLYPWGFLSQGITRNLYPDGMTARSLALEILSAYRIQGYKFLSSSEQEDQAWQENIRKLLHEELASNRLDMLESGINPLTGKSTLRQHTFFEKNLGMYRKLYAEMKRTSRVRACKRFLREETFPAGFSP